MVPVSEPLPGDSPRVRGEDATHVENLVNARDPLPPIVVHRATMRVIDGTHRLKAAKERGDRELAVEYFDGSAQDAFLRAVRENAVHGLPLSRADREAAVRRIIEADAGMSDRAIARVAGLSPPTIAAIRRRSTDNTLQSNKRHGRTRPMSAVEGRLRAGRLIAERPAASSRALGRDASLRLSEAGRALLQWLEVCARQHEREQIDNAIPEHCVEIILELAASCAESWMQLRHDLERRTRRRGG
jgi:ParB-like nuclease family protein